MNDNNQIENVLNTLLKRVASLCAGLRYVCEAATNATTSERHELRKQGDDADSIMHRLYATNLGYHVKRNVTLRHYRTVQDMHAGGVLGAATAACSTAHTDQEMCKLRDDTQVRITAYETEMRGAERRFAELKQKLGLQEGE